MMMMMMMTRKRIPKDVFERNSSQTLLGIKFTLTVRFKTEQHNGQHAARLVTFFSSPFNTSDRTFLAE